MGRRRWTLWGTLAVVVATTVPAAGTVTATAGATATARTPNSGYLVYWDQNEEEDYYASASGTEAQLVTPWTRTARCAC
jgi:hypothetical protein